MIKILFTLIFSLLNLIASAFAQAPEILWTKTFGGINNDIANSVQQTSDGGYIIAGCTKSFGNGDYDIWLVRTNDAGDTLWTKTFGETEQDVAESVQQTSDGGYILTGSTRSFGADSVDAIYFKTNASGDSLWMKIIGGAKVEVGTSVQENSGGGYIITGYTNSFGAGGDDIFLRRTGPLGNPLWTKTFGGTDGEFGESIQQTFGGGYIIAGRRNRIIGSDDVWLICTDTSGDTLWTKIFGGPSSDLALSVQQTSDNGFIIAGHTYSGSSVYDIWLIRTNQSGDTLWTKTIGGSSYDFSSSCQQTSDGGFIVAGSTYSFGAGSYDVYLIRTNSSGDTLWTKTIGGSSSDQAYSVRQTSDGGYIVAGYTNSYGSGQSDAWLIRLAPESTIPVELSSFTATTNENSVELKWITATETNNRGFEIQRQVVNTQSAIGSSKSEIQYPKWELVGFVGGYGTTTELQNYYLMDKNVAPGNYRYRLKQIDFDGTIEYSPEVEVQVSSPKKFSLSQNYPNPFNPTTKISWQLPAGTWQTLKIYDLLGNEVATLADEFKAAGTYEIEFDASSLSSGVYFYQLQAGSFSETKKLILMK